jgi:hypothetical protein
VGDSRLADSVLSMLGMLLARGKPLRSSSASEALCLCLNDIAAWERSLVGAEPDSDEMRGR